MKLVDYTDLINKMPVSAHAFTCLRKNWKLHFDRRRAFGKALSEIFDTLDEVTVARSDLRDFAKKQNLDVFAVATVLWGYPTGMRGRDVENIRSSFPRLVELLEAVRKGKIETWEAHCDELSRIHGVGLSTYTKFLTFLDIRVDGYMAMILDSRIAEVSRRPVFDEMTSIHGLTHEYGIRRYPEYLSWLHSTATRLNVPAENLEFFLYEFGGNLKDATQRSATRS